MIPNTALPFPDLDWPAGVTSRVPFRLYMDDDVRAAEQARLFQGPVWQFLCLADEVPNVGDYKTTYAGETPVIVTRSEDESQCLREPLRPQRALVCLGTGATLKS